jgi:tetratricopeptide (TPR) repeat protein
VPQSPWDEESLTPFVLGRIDEACDRFEDAWQAGHRPRLEDYLGGAVGPELAARLRRLLRVELDYRRGRGEAPGKEEYRRAFPDYPQAVDDAFAAASSVREVNGLPETVPHQSGEGGRAEVSANGAGPLPGALSPESEVPERAGRYRIEGEVDRGRGGMGIVLRARDPELKRPLAVKVLRARYRGDPELTRRFLAEAQITSQLQHPCVPPVHEVGSLADGRPFMALKLIQGRALDVLLAGRLSPRHDLSHWLAVFGQACQAVAYAHSQGVLHRDLKPQNVMVGAFGEVQLMDWGLAKVLASPDVATSGPLVSSGPPAPAPSAQVADSPQATQPGAVVGTPGYMAPEQARGEPVDARADVFGLGAILCEVLTGAPPFLGKDSVDVVLRTVAGELTAAFTRLDGCGADAELIALAKACLAAERDGRPTNGAAVAEAVADFQVGVQERLRKAELDRAAAEAREQEARAKVEAERRAAEAERVAAEAREQQAQAMASAAFATALAERKRRRLTVALAVATLLLVVIGGAVGWRWQRQRAEAGSRALLAVEQGRVRLEEGWRDHDLAKLKEVKAEADRAVYIASRADERVRRQAADFQDEAKQRLARAEKNYALMAALANVASPRETGAYDADGSGRMLAAAEPSVDQQYARAFQRWGLDLGRTPEDEVVALIQDEPAPVVQEVIAALGAWMVERRGTHLATAPGEKAPEGEWERLLRLADRLDDSPTRRRLRALLARGARPQVGTAARMSVAAAGLGQPWGALAPLVPRGEARALLGKINPARESALTVLLLARLSEAEWDLSGAEDLLRRAVTARPNEVVLLDGLAQLLVRQGRLAEAVEFYRGARAVRPQLGVGLAQALRQAGRSAEGEGVLRELVDRSPDNPEMHFHLGNALYAQKKYAEAEAAFRKAIALKRDFPEAYFNLGVALSHQKKHAAAEAACRRAIALKHDYPEAHFNLGIALRRQKKYAAASAAYRQAIALKRDYPEAHFNLGIALRSQKKDAEAEAAYRQAIALKHDYPEAHCNLGASLIAQGRFTEALAAYRQGHALGSKVPGWPYPSEAWARHAERLVTLDQLLPKVLARKARAASAAEALELASLCQLPSRQLHAGAARLAADAFATDPKLAADLAGYHRYNAACRAALAAAGEGKDAKGLTDRERMTLRRQALTWLRADLAGWAKLAKNADDTTRQRIAGTLAHWQKDADLAGLRDPPALARLSAEERAACERLWADVAGLLGKARKGG